MCIYIYGASVQGAAAVANGCGSPCRWHQYSGRLWLQMVLGVLSRWCVVAEGVRADGVGAEGDGTGGVRTGVGADVVGADGVGLEGVGFARPRGGVLY